MNDIPRDIFALLFTLLLTLGVFLSLQIAEKEGARKSALRVISTPQLVATATPGEGTSTAGSSGGETRGLYVGSMNGKTYHLPSCAGAKRIREENKVWFATKQEAQLRGYKPATNCKGI